VELDCWDGGDGTPNVTHGHTVVGHVKFRDVIQTVKDYGFLASPYPLILSLENHCSVEQQIVMAKILVELLGDMLPKPFILEQTRPLPSPESLKYKVLVKGKILAASPHDEILEEKLEEEEEEEDDASSADMEEEDDEEESKPDVAKPEEGVKVEKTVPKDEAKGEGKKKKLHGTAKELSDLVHLKGTPFAGIQAAKDKNAPWEISSLSEHKVKKLVKADYAAAVDYALQQVVRVYPKGTRFDSSNYMPVPSWVAGFNAVALNFQTKDLPMRLNMGKFLDNGGSGYVLKSNALRAIKDETSFSKTIHVKLISGWQLPKESGTPKGEVIDPYVKMRTYGLPEDSKKYRSKVIQNNGFNPHWDEKVSFSFSRADLAQLHFEVWDQDKLSKDDLIGFASIPVSSLKPGYRSVHLFDRKANALPEASIFVHFSFE